MNKININCVILVKFHNKKLTIYNPFNTKHLSIEHLIKKPLNRFSESNPVPFFNIQKPTI